MSAKGKSFTADLESNPAMRFITQPQERPQEPTEPAEQTRLISDPEQQRPTQRFIYAEKKSQRVQIVMQPSIISKAKAAAERDNISLNEYIHRAIIEKLNREEHN